MYRWPALLHLSSENGSIDVGGTLHFGSKNIFWSIPARKLGKHLKNMRFSASGVLITYRVGPSLSEPGLLKYTSNISIASVQDHPTSISSTFSWL